MSRTGNAFLSPIDRCLANCYAGGIEDLGEVGFKIVRREEFQEEKRRLLSALAAIEKKALPLISALLGTLNPEKSRNIQKLTPHKIWLLYWYEKNDTRETNFSTFLVQLNNRPQLPSLQNF